MEIDLHFMPTPFSYIKSAYNVPAEMYREVLVDGKRGVITKDLGNYIGVNFYDSITYTPVVCHPTWKVEYLETFNHKPPVEKITASKKRYLDYLNADNGQTFAEYLGIKKQRQ